MRDGSRRGRRIRLGNVSKSREETSNGLTIVVISLQLFRDPVVDLLVVFRLSLHVQRGRGNGTGFLADGLELLESFLGRGVRGQEVVGTTGDGGGSETADEEAVAGSGFGLTTARTRSVTRRETRTKGLQLQRRILVAWPGRPVDGQRHGRQRRLGEQE
jgi:hypothetical protein